MTTFQINDYYEAVALYRLLLSYKYAPNPMHREIFGSPLIATLHIRLAQTLNLMEMERPHPSNHVGWTPQISVGTVIWSLLAENCAAYTGNGWFKLTPEQKRQFAFVILAPFTFDDATCNQFLVEVEARLTPPV
jgi:hypothetical protein